jgi:hypothetical protein
MRHDQGLRPGANPTENHSQNGVGAKYLSANLDDD